MNPTTVEIHFLETFNQETPQVPHATGSPSRIKMQKQQLETTPFPAPVNSR